MDRRETKKTETKKTAFQWKYIFWGLSLCFALFILGYVSRLPHWNAKFNNEDCYLLSDGWEYLSQNGEKQSLTLPFNVKPNNGDSVVISHRLPIYYEDAINTFAVWTGMKYINAYLDGESIYQYENATEYGKVEGSGWLIIRLPENWQGKKLTLEITSPYEEYVGNMKTILLGTKASILFELVEEYGVNVLIALCLIALGIILNIFYLFFRKVLNGEKGISYLGCFQILTGIWLFTEGALTQFFFDNMLIIDTLTYVSLAVLPIPLLLYLLENKHSKMDGVLHIAVASHTIFTVILVLLQTFQIRAMYEMLPISHFLIACSGAIIIVVSLIDIFVYKNKALHFMGYASLILSISGIFELYFFYQGNRMVVGEFFRVAIVVCMILITGVVVRKVFSVVRMSSEAIYYEKLALLDFMTKCQNRTSYQKELEKQEKRIFEKESITLVVADLNNLKQMNDTLGHHIGDAAIKLCGKMMLQTFREIGTCYRVGGDEFACIIYNYKEKVIKERIEVFKELCEAENQEWEYEFKVAIGYAVFDKKHDNCLEETMSRADKQMYEDKRLSKMNCQMTERQGC